jgi:hypothetical protein
VLFPNQTAEQILLSRDGLEVTDQGVLQPISKWSNPTLARIMQQAAQVPQSNTQEAKDVILAIRRPSGKRPFTLLVRSLKRSSSSDSMAPSVLVFVWDCRNTIPKRDCESFSVHVVRGTAGNLLWKGNRSTIVALILRFVPPLFTAPCKSIREDRSATSGSVGLVTLEECWHSAH